jgi:hypothetical protein
MGHPSLAPISGPGEDWTMKLALALNKLNREVSQGYRDQQPKDESDSDPTWVITTKRSDRIIAYAKRLANEGREDDAAVDELVAAVGRHHHELVVAGRYFHVSGQYKEDRIANRAERLIHAAMNRSSVSPPSESDETVLSALEGLGQLDAATAFDRLAQGQTGLRDLKDELDRGSFNQEPDSALDFRLHLRDRLAPLVGPQSTNADPVLRSNMALELSVDYLASLKH